MNCRRIDYLMRAMFAIFLLMLAVGGFADTVTFAISHGPYLQHLDNTAVTIVWTTSRNSVGWVELAPNGNDSFYAKEQSRFFDTRYGIKMVSTLHTVRLTDLKPGTKYRYRVLSQEVASALESAARYGDFSATDVYSREPLMFTTPDPASKAAGFAMINDIHGHNDTMTALLKQVPWKSTDVVLFNGDMSSVMQSESQVFKDFMDTAVNTFAGETPVLFARGNHETRGYFASRFADYFPSPSGALYYIVRRGPVCFIVLDSGEDKPDSDIEYNGANDFTGYRTSEAAWLKKALQDETVRSAAYRIVVVHIPPTDSWYGSREVARLFMPILNDAGIDVMLCGHMHEYHRLQPKSGEFNFPIIVNSNDTLLLGSADGKGLNIKITGVDGKLVDEVSLQRRKH